jgi:hypothetical protein
VGIKIPFLADVTDFLRGTKDLEEALVDVVDSLDDITTAGADVDSKVGASLDDVATAAGDASAKVADLGTDLLDIAKADTSKTETEIEAIGKSADTSAEKLESSFSAAFDKLRTESKTATDRAKSNIKDTGDKGSESLREFNEEAKQNVAETVSSFDGSASSGVEAIQATFGGLVASLGPAGLIGAAAAGIGIGLGRSLFAKAAEAAEALREQIGDIFDELRENQGVITKTFQSEAIADLLKDTKAFETSFGVDMPTAVRLFGDDLDTVLQGLTGSSEQVAAAQDVVNQMWEDSAESGGVYVDENGNVLLSNQELADSLGETGLALKAHQEALDGGVTAHSVYADATDELTEATVKATTAVVAKTAAVQADTEAAIAASDAQIGYEQAVDDATEAAQKNGETHDLNTQKGRDNVKALNAQASALVALALEHSNDGTKVKAYNRVIADNRAEFIKVAEKIGFTKGEAKKLATQYGLIPKKVKTDVTDDGTAEETKGRIKGIKGKTVKVTVRPDMPTEAELQATINAYYSGLSIKVPVELDRYRSGKKVG